MPGRTFLRRAPRATRRSLAALAVGTAVALGACVPLAPAAVAPPFPGLGGTIQQYTGNECHNVLIAGDSLFNTVAPYLQAALADSGRTCATVENYSLDGSSTGDWLDPSHGLWTNLLAHASPGDILVLELAGNSGLWTGPAYGDPSWLQQNAANAQQLTNDALGAGLHVYWVIPPLSGIFCNFTQVSAMHLLEWKGWIADTLPGLYPPGQIGYINWRFPFGGERYSQSFVFPDGMHNVRNNDCVHFVTRGDEVAADATVLAIQHEWAVPAPPTSTTSTSSSTTSSTSSSTSSSSTSSTTSSTLAGG